MIALTGVISPEKVRRFSPLQAEKANSIAERKVCA